MKTFSTQYISKKELELFIDKHEIAKHQDTLLQIFTGICDLTYIEKLLKEIKEFLPQIKIIGSTTSGEIYDAVAQINSTVLSFSLFEKTKIKTYYSEIIKDSYTTAQNLIDKFDTQETPKLAISFADGLNINGEEYINAFHDYNKELIVSGGLAGDNATFTQTIVFTEQKIVTQGAVVALFFNETLEVVTNASFGWEQIGKTMRITKVDKNIVYEIDGEKAVAIYEKYLGKDIAEELPNVGVEFPLIIKKGNLSIPRAVIGRGEDASLIFAGSLSQGDKVTFGYGNIQTILHYGRKIYDDKAIQQSESIFVYSCMARLRLLNENINTELNILKNIAKVSGFFTYGEFYFDQENKKHELLNQTMTIVGLSEGGEKKETLSELEKIDFQEHYKQNLTLKALSHLICETSKELEEMNLSLQDKVKIEVEKNRQKDKAMLHQGKLAQMGEMISMIAHQWRQPLSAISSLSQGLSLKAALGTLEKETMVDLSESITNHAQYLSTTIDDFREFFRPRKEKKDTTYNEIIVSVLNIIETSIVTKDIEIIKDLQLEECFYSYPNEIKQVVLNLIKNAEDALLENKVINPYIKIRTYKKGSFFVLEVSDNAGGIPKEIQEKIFNPYFSTKMEKNGTGLGLYMSKTIIEDHCNGRLSVENKADGAMFLIEIEKQERDIKGTLDV